MPKGKPDDERIRGQAKVFCRFLITETERQYEEIRKRVALVEAISEKFNLTEGEE